MTMNDQLTIHWMTMSCVLLLLLLLLMVMMVTMVVIMHKSDIHWYRTSVARDTRLNSGATQRMNFSCSGWLFCWLGDPRVVNTCMAVCDASVSCYWLQTHRQTQTQTQTDWERKKEKIFTARQHSLLCRALYSYDRFCLSVWRYSDRLSVRHAKTTQAIGLIMRSSLDDSTMTLVSSWLTSARNSKGNIGSEVAEWDGWKK